MGGSDVSVHELGSGLIDIDARGGTRRQRGAAIGAVVRTFPGGLELLGVSYSETYGFQSATFARYRRRVRP